MVIIIKSRVVAQSNTKEKPHNHKHHQSRRYDNNNNINASMTRDAVTRVRIRGIRYTVNV